MAKVKTIFLLLFAVATIVSCKKDHHVLGADVQPENDVLGASFTDAVPVYAHTVLHKPTYCFPSEVKFLGSNQDPVFGRTDVGLYTNIGIPDAITNVSFGADANLVSAEIILAVPSLDFIGNYFTPLSYSVFPVVNTLSASTVYYSSNDSLHDKSVVLGSYTGTFSVLNDKFVLRIPVDNNYAKAILNNPQYLVDNATFRNTYKGFYISSAASSLNPGNLQGMISKYDLSDALSGFYLYYQNGTPSAIKETKSFKFTFTGSGAVKLNTIKYQPGSGGNANLYSQLAGDTTKGKQNLFLKGLAGTKLKLYLPDLKSYADSFKIAVNRAELVLNVDPSYITTSSTGQYIPPPHLALLAMDSLQRENFVLDQLTTVDAARYDGTYDQANNRYVFNIARQVQAIMNGTKKNYGFYVVVADPSAVYAVKRDNIAERVVLAGSDNASLKPKFNLSYIKFKNDK